MTSWFPLLDYTTNAYHLWHYDELLIRALSILSGDYPINSRELHGVFLVILTLGNVLLLRRLKSEDNVTNSAFSSLGFVVLLALVFNMSTVVLSSLMWVPWLVAAYLDSFAKKRSSLVAFVLVAFFVTRVIASSGPLSPILVCFAAGTAYILAKYQLETFSLTENLQKNILLFISVFPVIGSLYFIPITEFPDYPPQSHIVADDNVAGVIRPLIGSTPPVPHIDRVALKEQLFEVTGATLLLSVFSLGSSIGILATSLAASVALDVYLPDTFAQIMPAYSLKRMVPELFYLTLSPVILALSLFSLWAALVFRAKWQALLAFVFIGGVSIYFHQPETNLFKEELAPDVQTLLYSPSYSLVKSQGIFVLTNRERIKGLRRIPAEGKIEAIDITKGSIDKTRISLGTQLGEELLTLRFSEPQTISGIEPSPGKFASDFPRGVEVSYQTKCEGGWQKVVSIPNWQGAIRYTKEDYPYYIGQDKVEILFPKEITAQCIRIKQISKSPFDWSIAEIYLLR